MKSTSPDITNSVHLYDMQEEFVGVVDHARPMFFTEGIGEEAAWHGNGTTQPVSTSVQIDEPPIPEPVPAEPHFPDIPSPDEALLGTVIQELVQQQQRMRTQVPQRVCELAVLMAKKIIGRVGDERPEMVFDQVRIALDKVGPDPSLTIRVHPRDAEYLSARKDTILKSVEHIERVVITADQSMSRGGCIIETGLEVIDASIESQLELLELAIKEQGIVDTDATS